MSPRGDSPGRGGVLEHRIEALESRERVRRAIAIDGDACDKGPYDGPRLVAMWAEGGEFDSGAAVYRGYDEILGFYDNLAATSTIHYFTNVVVDLDASNGTARAACDGFEVPVIGGKSLYGCFEHFVSCRAGDVQRLWLHWRQRVHFLAPSATGWEKGDRVVNQYADSDQSGPAPAEPGEE